MKLLLDENLPHRLRLHLPGYEVYTVAYMKWVGVGNGTLLTLAAQQGFEAFLTKDLGIEYQQNVNELACAIVVLEAPSNSLKDILPLVPSLLEALANLRPKAVTRIK